MQKISHAVQKSLFLVQDVGYPSKNSLSDLWSIVQVEQQQQQQQCSFLVADTQLYKCFVRPSVLESKSGKTSVLDVF